MKFYQNPMKFEKNNHWKSHENQNRPKNEAKIDISLSKSLVGPTSQCHMKDWSNSELCFAKITFYLNLLVE